MQKDDPNRFGHRRCNHSLAARPSTLSPRPHRAFTLIELILSMAIMAMILLGMQSAMMLASRAAPDSRSAPSVKAEAGRALQTLLDDVAYATAVSKATATELILTVPDRDGDGNPDTIRYFWNTSGANLTRQYNSNSPQILASAVQSLSFTFDSQTKTTAATTATDGAEILLASFDTSSGPKDFVVDSSHSIAACFRPNIPSSALSWSVTRVKFKACANGSTYGQAYVQIRPAIGSLPGSDVLAQATMTEPTSTNYAWKDISLSGASGLTPGTAAALVIQWASDSDAGLIAYRDNDTVSSANLATTSGGSTWSTASGEMLFYAYGTIRTPDPAITQTTLRSVRCTMGFAGNISVDVTARAFNEPVVSP